MNHVVVFRNVVIRGRHLTVADADGQDGIDALEGALGGLRAKGAVTPPDGERVVVGNHSLATDGGGDRGLEQLGDSDQGRARFGGSQTGINADATAGIAQNVDGLADGGLIPGRGQFQRDGVVVVPDH